MSTHVSTHQAKEDLRNEGLKIYLNGEIVEKIKVNQPTEKKIFGKYWKKYPYMK